MAVHFLCKHESYDYSIKFKTQGEKVLADYYFKGQYERSYSMDYHSVHVYSSSGIPLREIITRLLAENHIPYIQGEQIAWYQTAPAHDTVARVEHLLLQAQKFMEEEKNEEAISSLLEAQAQARIACVSYRFGEANVLEKIDRRMLQDLVDRTNNENIKLLLLQKDAVRQAFEMSLGQLAAAAPHQKKPTCFICFSFGDEEVVDWLKHTFVPDLDRMGIAPVFCLRQLGPGKDLNSFQELIKTTDLVVIVCTPDLKQKCIDRASHPIGVAEEICFAQTRHKNDPGRRNTIYPIYLKGLREQLCPCDDFESIVARQPTFFGNNTDDHLYSYYEVVFEVFGNMRNIPREQSVEALENFFKLTRDILRDNITIDREAVAKWLVERAQHQKKVQDTAEGVVDEVMGRPLIRPARIKLDLPHPNFVEREALLDKIAEKFQLREWHYANHTKISILCGLGGIGKTELAITFGNKFLSCFSLIWVIRAESPDLFEDDYRSLAKVLNLDIKGDDFIVVLRKVHEALQQGIKEEGNNDPSHPWLLILDNAVNKIEIPQRGGYVLATTQHKESHSDPNAFIEVSTFSLPESDSLLRKLDCVIPKDDVQRLVDELEGFPVLLEQVGLFLRNTPFSVKEYLEQIRSTGDVFWNEPGQRYPKALGKVFELALEALRTKSVHAYAFIQFCAYLNPDSISLHLLDFWVQTYKLPTSVKGNIVVALRDAFLMRYHASTESYSLHRLVQAVLQRLDARQEGRQYHASTRSCSFRRLIQAVFQRLFARQEHEQYHLTAHLLAMWAKQFDSQKIETWQIGEECTRHLAQVKNFHLWKILKPKPKSDLLFASGVWYSDVKADPKKGLELIQDGHCYAQKVYPEESKEIALYLREIGGCYKDMEEKDTAHQFFKNSHRMCKKVFGMDNRETAASYNLLSLTTPKGPAKQLDYRMKAMKIWHEVHQNKAHPDIALAYHNIGHHLHAVGRRDEAQVMVNIAIEMDEGYYKRPHPMIAHHYLLLGVIQDNSSLVEGLSALYESARNFKDAYGKTHTRVAEVIVEIGKIYKKLKQFEDALQNYEEALSIYRELYGENHTKLAEICMYKGEILQDQGHHEKALANRKEALRIWQSIPIKDPFYLGSGHLAIAQSLSSLSRFEEALTHSKEAQRILSLKDPDSHLTLTAHNNTGSYLESLNKHSEALLNYVKAVKDAIRTRHANLPIFFKNTLQLLQKQTDSKLVLSTKKDLLEYCTVELGEDNEFKAQLEAITLPDESSCALQ